MNKETSPAAGDETDLLKQLPHLRKPKAGDVPVARVIDPLVREGELYDQLDKDWVYCYACGHRCKIPPGARGICQVRYNLGGKLMVPWGYVAALQCDPTEDINAGRPIARISPEQMIDMALKYRARCVASSYNEPLITSEWAQAIFKEARKHGLTCLYVSNGNATREVLEYLKPYMQGYKIDLKTMNDRHYRKLGMP